jgi:probable F420-dependent oxidoreductase
MKFSLAIPRPGDTPNPAEVDDMVRIAQAVERAGLHAVSASDHPFPYVVKGEAGHQSLDPFVLMSFIASATTAVNLHFSLIVVPYRNPFLVARMLGTLDLVSRGRVIAGLGAGYLRPEFDAVGADFSERGVQIDEAVDAMRAAWTGEPVTLEGRDWKAAGNTMRPVPLTSPHPVLWRGGNAPSAIRSTIAKGYDGWAPFEVSEHDAEMTKSAAMTPAVLPGRLAILREAAHDAGRTRPVDVCYVRTSRRWLKERSQTVDELLAFEAMGVSWLEFTVPGRTADETIAGIESFAEIANSVGVL